jgi:DDE superfamily endonuclease
LLAQIGPRAPNLSLPSQATMTHDYKRHGTTTLFAALNVLDGTVISHNMKRHRHQEFIRFLNTIEAQVPKRKAIHAIVDNYATHKHPKVREWLARHRRWSFHFSPRPRRCVKTSSCLSHHLYRSLSLTRVEMVALD